MAATATSRGTTANSRIFRRSFMKKKGQGHAAYCAAQRAAGLAAVARGALDFTASAEYCCAALRSNTQRACVVPRLLRLRRIEILRPAPPGRSVDARVQHRTTTILPTRKTPAHTALSRREARGAFLMQTSSKGLGRHLVWLAIAVLGAFALGTVALARGETINALWIVIAAVCVYLIAYRYYSRFIADKVFQLDASRMTPAWKYND